MTTESSFEINKNGQPQPFIPALLAKLDFAIGPVFSLDLSPDGRRLASAGYDQIKIWDVGSQAETVTFQAHDNAIWGIAWSPDSACLASASMDGTVKLWNTLNWQNAGVFETGLAMCAAWSPDGNLLATGTFTFIEESRPETYAGKAQIWDMGSHLLIRELVVSSIIVCIGWSMDGRTLAIGQWDGKLTFWDGVSDQPSKSLMATTERSDVNGLLWSADGRLLVTAQQDGKVRIWNPETGEILKTFAGHTAGIRGLAWSPDEKMLASTGLDADIRVWRVEDGQLVAQWIPDALPKWSLVWSPDGSWLAAGNGVFGAEPSGAQVLVYKMS